MTGKTHSKVGTLAPILASTVYYIHYGTKVDLIGVILLTAFSIIGSTLPDIDQTQSKSGKKFPITSHLLKGVHSISKKLGFKRVQRATGHRGATHSLLLWSILYWVAEVILLKMHFNQYIAFSVNGLFLGVISHLFLDMLTKTGIPLLAPFSYTAVHIASMKTGTKQEKTFSSLICLLLIIFIIINIVKLHRLGLIDLSYMINNIENLFSPIMSLFLKMMDWFKSLS